MTNTEILNLLHREVVPAIGCTEPIAVALCVAKAREQLGCEPQEIHVYLSKNIYKNALAVGIPNTGMTGLPIAIALGATIGKSCYGLEVLRDADDRAVQYAKEYMDAIVRADGHQAEATIQHEHTHFVTSTENPEPRTDNREPRTENQELTLREVYDYALTVNPADVAFLLDGAKMNKEAAEQSFRGAYGHGLGRLLHDGASSTLFGDTAFTHILAYTCGACDARMSGAMVPVMSNSGSGNQGVSCSLPVYIYALEHHVRDEQLLRALTISNLTAIYIKQSLGRLSALCGCVVASTGSACGITYLMGGGYEELTYAIKNMIANISGMICDGAKPGCALKVTSGVATAVLSATLAIQHAHADNTEGSVEEDIDRTIHNLTRIGRDGMSRTDDLILDIMTHKKMEN